METNGQHLSHTQISCLLACPRKYYYRYIERIKTPMTPSLLMGGAYHAGVERNFVAKVKTGHDLEVPEVLEAYDREWNQRLSAEAMDWQEKSPGEVKDSGARLLALYMETMAPFVMPAEVERQFSVSIPGVEGWTIDGRIDLITSDGTIVDHKTSGKAKSQGDIDTELQFSCYAAAIFADPMLEEVTCEFHTAIDKAKPEVQRLQTTRNREDVEWYLNLARDCLSQIRAGVFPPNPTGFLCSPKWCGYWSKCKGGAR